MFNITGKLIFVSEVTHHEEDLCTSFLVIDHVAKNEFKHQQLKFEAKNEVCDVLQLLKLGQKVYVFFKLKGKGSHGIFRTKLEVYKVLVSGESKKDPLKQDPKPFETPPPDEFVENWLTEDYPNKAPF